MVTVSRIGMIGLCLKSSHLVLMDFAFCLALLLPFPLGPLISDYKRWGYLPDPKPAFH